MSVLELEAVLLNQKDKASLLESLELLDFTKCDEKGELCVGRFSFSKLIDQKKYGIVLHGVSCFLFFFLFQMLHSLEKKTLGDDLWQGTV